MPGKPGTFVSILWQDLMKSSGDSRILSRGRGIPNPDLLRCGISHPTSGFETNSDFKSIGNNLLPSAERERTKEKGREQAQLMEPKRQTTAKFGQNVKLDYMSG